MKIRPCFKRRNVWFSWHIVLRSPTSKRRNSHQRTPFYFYIQDNINEALDTRIRDCTGGLTIRMHPFHLWEIPLIKLAVLTPFKANFSKEYANIQISCFKTRQWLKIILTQHARRAPIKEHVLSKLRFLVFYKCLTARRFAISFSRF